MLLSCWLCVVLTDQVLKVPLPELQKHEKQMVRALVTFHKQHNAVPHPEVLIKLALDKQM